MSENIKQIALRMKTLREIAGATVEEIADEFKIPGETYRDYENGSVDIPVSFLLEFANRFKVELTALLTGEEPKLHRNSLVRSGKGLSVERRKEYDYQDLAYNFIHKKAEVFLVTVGPHARQRSYHHYNHPGQEFTYVLEGTLNVMIDGHEVILEKGDSLFFDSGHNHAMSAGKGRPAKFLAVIL